MNSSIDVKTFHIADYVVFFLCLAVSAAIGIYFGCTGGKQATNREFLMADRSMHVIPVSMSLIASFMSAISILGTPSEIYTYGMMYIWILPSFIFAMYIAAYLYIPVFYKLEVTSAYEYLEKRFGKVIRVLGALCYIFQMVAYMAIVLYAPGLAISAVTGLNVYVAVVSVGAVTTFYTALGGMKAVMWTDTFQIIVMFSGMLAVVIQGLVDMGPTYIWETAKESGRIDFYDASKVFDPNPLERHTFWTLVVGATFYWTACYGTNQAQIQRALSVNSLQKAQRTFWINLPGLLLITLLGVGAGLVIYAQFASCDPIEQGYITKKDQLYPFYVMVALGHAPGLPGLIVSAVASGSLSTISSGLNSLAAVLLQDIIKVLCKPDISEARANRVSKIIAVVMGLLVIGLAFVVGSLGQILQAGITLFGAFGGPIFAVFTLGLFVPFANSFGAISGFLSSLVITTWFAMGAQFNRTPQFTYPISTDGCDINKTTNTTYMNTTTAYSNITPFNTTTVEPFVQEYNVYSLSYQYLTLLSLLVCLTVGIVVSLISGGLRQTIDEDLLSPVGLQLCCCLPWKFREKFLCGVKIRPREETDTEMKERNDLD